MKTLSLVSVLALATLTVAGAFGTFLSFSEGYVVLTTIFLLGYAFSELFAREATPPQYTRIPPVLQARRQRLSSLLPRE